MIVKGGWDRWMRGWVQWNGTGLGYGAGMGHRVYITLILEYWNWALENYRRFEESSLEEKEERGGKERWRRKSGFKYQFCS